MAVWRVWHSWRTTGPDGSWLASAGIAGSMAIGAMVIGYYLAYSAGICRRLKTLKLHVCKIVTGASLKELAACKRLESLDLSACEKVTDDGLKELAALPRLQTLNLEFDKVTDAGLKELAASKSLRTLDLSSCYKVTDEGVKELAARAGIKPEN